MENSEINKDIKHFEYISKDKFDVVEKLVTKNYSEDQIITAYNNHSFKKNWNGNTVGIFMILLAIGIAISVQPVSGSLSYLFDSRGDFIRLNELVFKPFAMIVTLFIGICMLINRGFCNDKQLKITMIVFYSIFMLTSFSSHTAYPLLYVPPGIILFSMLKLHNPSNKSDAELLLESVQNGIEKENVLQQIDIKSWKGSNLFFYLILSSLLFINSPIVIAGTFNEVTLLDYALSINIRLLTLGGIIVGILIGINKEKFNVGLLIIVALSSIHIFLSLIHSNFQKSIVPALIIIIGWLAIKYGNDIINRLKK